MQITPEQASFLIRSRRAIFPAAFTDRPVARGILREILENANWAPSHKHTEPWRFQVYTEKGLEQLSAALETLYREYTPSDKFSEMKFRKLRGKAMASGAVIAIIMQRDPQNRLPEWEEMMAVGCAVQNLWLSLYPYGLGGYWSSPAFIENAGPHLDLQEGERCLGFFYLGYYDTEHPEGKKGPLEEKVRWVDGGK